MFTGNYVVYSRCSTEEQKKSGFSHEYQTDSIKRIMSNYDDSVLVGEYQDTITGTSFERPQLLALYNYCKSNQGAIDYVLVYKWDRFGRNVAECLKWVDKFKAIGVEVNSILERIDFDTTDYILFLSIRFGLAQTESMKISERTRDGLYQSNRMGFFTGSPPFGFKRVESDQKTNSGKRRKVLVPDENAPYVKEIFDRFISGEDRGALYREYSKKINIKKSQFYRMFENPLYAGFVDVKAYRDFPAERVQGAHEAIVSNEVFEQAQQRLNDYNRTNKGQSWAVGQTLTEEFYLKGVIACNISGKKMTASFSKGRSKKYPYYHGTGKKRQRIKKDTAHSIVEEAIKELSSNFTSADAQIVQEYIDEMIEPKRKIIRNLKKKEKKLTKRLKKIESDYLDGELAAPDWKRLSTSLLVEKSDNSKEIDKIERMLTMIPKVDLQTLERLCQVSTIYMNSDNKLKRKLLKAIFPEDFSIDVQERKVRTTHVNRLLCPEGSNSSTYKNLEIKKGQELTSCPVRGGRRDLNPRPLEPQSSALTN